MNAYARHLIFILCFCLVPAALSIGCAARAADSVHPREAVEDAAVTDWSEVERLIEDQLYEQAADRTASLRAAATAAGDVDGWTRGLVQEVQLRTALHGYERAVALLRDESWPDSARHQAILQLFYAHGLVQYASAYSWEIRQRERIDGDEPLDLDQWTLEQVVEEADRAYGEVWAARDAWGDEPLGWLERYVEKNDYPPEVRGTFRDTISYLWTEFLADSSYWSPQESNRVYRLDLDKLISGGPSEGTHSLERLAGVLGDLEVWHQESGRAEAALEARLERLRRLHSAFSSEPDRSVLRESLAGHLESFDRSLAWWSAGQAQLADWVRTAGGVESAIEARRLALEGRDAHPATYGGRRCAHLVASIEMPSLDLASMATDGLDRRSLRVEHRNLGELHFSAYRVDLSTRLQRTRSRQILPSREDARTLVGRSNPDYTWTEALPPTPDYRSHVSFVTPPIERPGTYVIVATPRPEFDDEGLFAAVTLVVSDVVLIRREAPGSVEVTVRSGSTGEPLHKVPVALWQRDFRRGHRRAVSHETNLLGQTQFRYPDRRGNFFLVAETEAGPIIDESYLSKRGGSRRQEGMRLLYYTDRSAYRPDQEVLWKVVAYDGSAEGGGFRTLANERFDVQLMDAGGESVETVSVETNEFGSASGRFTIPSGRLLGSWRLWSQRGASHEIRVEEYKRPTFEVSLLEAGEGLRLNRSARLEGEARYYFGLPLTSGTVEWRVERSAVYPRWWFWRPRPSSPNEVIAVGSSAIEEEGRFSIEFLAEADERQASEPGVSYRYRVTVDVTDEGGETRSAQRSFRLGFVSVEARVESDRGFWRAADSVAFDLRRSDLDGAAAPGSGSWRLLQLAQPAETVLPADRSIELRDEEARWATPGDRLRPRWDSAPPWERLARDWGDGAELRAGDITHGPSGREALELGALEPGAYRLRYETLDRYGARAEAQAEFLVVAPERNRLAAPAVLAVEKSSVRVGGVARVLVHSGLEKQPLLLEVYQAGRRLDLWRLDSSEGSQVIEIEVEEALRGGFGVRLTALRDHQLMSFSESIFVPWERELTVEFDSFRDLLRPGQQETWTVRLRAQEDEPLPIENAELLAYMYDRSLDLFAAHTPPDPLGIYPRRAGGWPVGSTLGTRRPMWFRNGDPRALPVASRLRADRLRFFDNYPIGGPGGRRYLAKSMPMALERGSQAVDATEGVITVTSESPLLEESESLGQIGDTSDPGGSGNEPPEPESLRSDFSETAFWEPHLKLEDDGTVAFEFTVPDSLTDWSVWVHALTSDLRSGRLQRSARSAKELMVRPYLPRFLREGDRAELRVLVDNSGEEPLRGDVELDIVDPESGESVRADFGLSPDDVRGQAFAIEPGESAAVTFSLSTPTRVGEVAFRVVAEAGDLSDGELRPVPILPGRMHLTQSRFVTLRGEDRRELTFEDLARDDDPSRVDDRLIVTLDAQLFYGVLGAMPYLVEYPYECTEQTLNRFLSTGIVSSVFESYPAVAAMAEKLATRDTRLETWNRDDPNRSMTLEETPWLAAARGGADIDGGELLKVLDPEVARLERASSLAELQRLQLPDGAFPWWSGGPPSPYMTLYLTYGFAKAMEFGVEVPKEMVVRAWGYLHRYWEKELSNLADDKMPHETVAFLNYVLSMLPDPSWTGGVFDAASREQMLESTLREWRRMSPLVKGYLALTLDRAGRGDDAKRVWESVMDSAKTTRDEGTFWAPEDRAWLWYNDTIESHAFALRVLGELDPADERRHGLVQWLFLNKQLNHWKSTRATAEVIYSLVHYLQAEDQLGVREAATVVVGSRTTELVFEPDEYRGRDQQIVVRSEEIDPELMATTVVTKETPGFLFASATWHFSTERLPEQGDGDLFSVRRALFRRVDVDGERVLRPLAAGERLEVGDQVEVHLVVQARHGAEYVHLRDPRAAGFEPESLASGYRWNLGLGWYEEVRDSGTNFFFERLPAGEYTLRYRLRAATAGEFKVAPATLQSMYAPEFAGYSAGAEVTIRSQP